MTNIQIALLGKETLPVYYPVKTEGADEVYIIRSNQNEEEAKRLKTVLEEEHIPCHIDNVVGAFDLKSINEVCENIHTKLPEDCSVTYNVTGGTKLMTIAALLVALNHNARVIYTDSNELIDVKDPNAEPETLNLKMDLSTFFKLQGQELRVDYQPYVKDKKLIECCNDIMQRIFLSKSGAYYTFAALRPLIEKEPTRKLFAKNNKVAEFRDGQLTLSNKGKIQYSCRFPHIRQLVFEGRWWENLVAEKINKWSAGRYDVYQNVTFLTNEGEDKNEIDILVNLGTKLVFIECKSGAQDQNVINKMDVIRRNYGSDKSESVLISFRPVSKNLKEKAQNSKICVIDRGTDEVDASLLNRIAGRLTDYLSTIKP